MQAEQLRDVVESIVGSEVAQEYRSAKPSTNSSGSAPRRLPGS
jgi:hypothetical protein